MYYSVCCLWSEAYNCDTCVSGAEEIIDSPLSDPIHCVAICAADNGTYKDRHHLVLLRLLHSPTTQECVCPDSYYGDTRTRTCELCHASCTTCVTSATNCQGCSSQYYRIGGSFPSTCANCDPGCNECTAACNSACQACHSSYYPVDLNPSSLVNPTDFALNYFLEGGTCK